MTVYTPVAQFQPEGEKWETYMTRFNCSLEASGFEAASDSRKRAIFLSHCGKEVLNTAASLTAPVPVEQTDWSTLQAMLKTHYSPTPSKLFQRWEFRQRVQKEGESVNQYLAALRTKAATAEFRDLEEAILEQFVCGLTDTQLRRRLLARANITLAQAVDEARAQETSLSANAQLQRTPRTDRGPKVAAVSTSSHPEGTCDVSSDGGEASSEEEVCRMTEPPNRKKKGKPCPSCGGSHPRQACRLREAICRRCGKSGHIARVCRAEKPAIFDSAPDESAANQKTRNPRRHFERSAKFERGQTHNLTIDYANLERGKKIHTNVCINNKDCRMEIDTGSPISIVPWGWAQEAFPGLTKENLQNQRMHLRDCQGRSIPVAGKKDVTVTYGQTKKTLPLTIVHGRFPHLLGMNWFEALGMGITGVHRTDTAAHSPSLPLRKELLKEFENVFDGSLGRYVGTPISFNLDPQVAPIRLKPRRVPLALKPKIDREIDKLVAQGILVPVDHAKWETPIVTPLKSDGTVRICADYKCTLNKALQPSAYPVPVIQHLLHSLGPGKIFAKLDLAQAYQQLPVDEATAEAQTIVTHRGAFKCTRLQFGVSVAPGIFQSTMERLLHGLTGVVPYFDDVLVIADNPQELKSRLTAVLARFQEAGLKVKSEKCLIGEPSVEFLGYRIDQKGIHPTESKVRAIQEAPTPKTKQELQAFLGLLNFYAAFLKDKATVAEPLHKLLASKAVWKWGREEDRAFRRVKNLLSQDSFLIQYNATLPLILVCDASPFGVGAVLGHRLPNGQEAPIAFYSRTLSAAERNYSQIDREALAAVAGVKKFHDYVYGREFELITDHRPLLGLLASDRPTPSALSPRMQRWALFLAGYAYRLSHRAGKEMGNADALSRCPLPDTIDDQHTDSAVFLIDIIDSAPITAAEVAKATNKDPELRMVSSWVRRGWPGRGEGELPAYANKREELSVMRGCVLWGDRVVIPEKLRRGVLETLHTSHPGIVRMKGLARSYVWWPNMDKDIEQWVARCQPCQLSRPNPPAAPTRDWEQPAGPWQRIHIDFAGPFHGHTFLIVVDAYSKWLEVKLMRNTTARAVISELRQLFATHGIPDVLVSDNGPQFTAVEFEGYLGTLGVRHALTAPFRPQGNGQAERFVRSAKEVLGRLGQGDWQERIDLYLLAQHNLPCTATGKSPAELLMGRKLRCTLDRLHPQYNPDRYKGEPDVVRDLAEGSPVFARNYTQGPLWEQGTIQQKVGPRSFVVGLDDGRVWRRHLDQLRQRTESNNKVPGTEPEATPPNTKPIPEIIEPVPVCQTPVPDSSPVPGYSSERADPAKTLPVEVTRSSPMERPGAEQRKENRSALLDAPATTELRRSSRTKTRPSHLSDFICK